MARKTAQSKGPAQEAVEVIYDGADDPILNAPDLNGGEVDVERFELPDKSEIDDPFLREVWDEVRESFPGGHYKGDKRNEGGHPKSMSGKGAPDTFPADTPEQAFAAIVEGRKMPGYEPAYDWGLAYPGGGVEAARGIAWENAPHSSHIHSFRWLDARKRARMGDPPSEFGRGRSELHVRFKRPNGGPTTVYVYFYVDHSRPTHSARCFIPR